MDQNGNKINKLPIVCPQCGQNFSATIPRTEITNNLTTSVAIASHEKPVRCINSKCGQYMLLGLVAVQVTWGARLATPEEVKILEPSRLFKLV